jgi:exonuclease SbcC
MKPLRLTVEGFTSFRDRLELDFSGLDLFAITGPTGAGKSSLIDAIVFALYGQVPRVGDDYKQLISHDAERLSVLFEFAVGGLRYRIVRSVRRERPSQQRLERLTAQGVEPVADRAREIRVEVERILGLDYDGFTRSVVLPQGQFDTFLKGEPKERRKILVALLGLSVYERMQALAGQRAAAARAEAEFVGKQMESDFAGATPRALEEARVELRAAASAAERAGAALARLAQAAEGAQAARAARRESEASLRDEKAQAAALAAAEATLAEADGRAAGLAGDLVAVKQQLADLGLDEARYQALTAAKPRAEQLLSLQPRLEKLAVALVSSRKALDEAQAAFSEATAALPALEQEERQAREQEAAARAGRDLAHRQHMAVALRRSSKPGEPCPVCAQTIGVLPAAEEPALDAAEAAVREAERRRQTSQDRLQRLRTDLAQRQAAVEGRSREQAQLAEQQRDTRALANEAVAELQRAGFLPLATADPAALAQGIEEELSQLERARGERARLEDERQSIEQRRAELASAVAAAATQRELARARLAETGARKEDAVRRLDHARRELSRLARAESWPGLDAPPAGRDEADVIEVLRATAQRASADTAARLATAQQVVERMEQAIVRVEELRARRAELEARAALHKTLADHLKANEIVAWIQEEALARLATEGSRHLSQLSQGRYELRLGAGDDEPAARAEQEYYVVDHWSGDAVRSVRTLSGGETFLASLGLALALAESLAELSTGGRAAEALESLFLDEGFGALDNETLDVVIGALDALHGGQRLVGIVTHVRELAERLPARLEVRRTGNVSTAAIV